MSTQNDPDWREDVMWMRQYLEDSRVYMGDEQAKLPCFARLVARLEARSMTTPHTEPLDLDWLVNLASIAVAEELDPYIHDAHWYVERIAKKFREVLTEELESMNATVVYQKEEPAP